MKKYSLILFGGNRLKENAPMTNVIEFLSRKKINFLVFTDHIHFNKLISKTKTFGSFLKEKKIPYFLSKKLKLKDIKKFSNSETKGFSLNSIWKFNDDTIKYFNRNLFNYHAGDLPTERGAGCISWRILLQKTRNISINIHRVEKTFDTGEIILSKKIKKKFKNALPEKINNYQAKLEKPFLISFLKKLILKKKIKFKGKIQKNNNSYYWPRLNSDLDGLIDWNWDAKSIVSFIKGFSHPFNGAFSYIDGLKIRIFDASFYISKVKFHPFQNGIIFRLDKKNIFVAASNHYIKIPINQIKTKKIKNKFFLGKKFK